MRCFKYKEDRWPVFLFMLMFALDLTVFFYASELWMLVGWMLLGIAPKTCICSFGHHHQHLNTFYQPFLNRLIEIPYGFLTGLTSHAWFLHHVVGHHMNFLDQSKDESRWMRKSGRTMGEIEYSTEVTVTAYPRAASVGKRYPEQMRTFVLMGLLQLALLGLMFSYNWLNALFVFLIPMVISVYMTAWHTWFHHAGLDTQDVNEASFNCVNKMYNVVTGNLGYHTAHHERGGLHWSLLPAYHDTIKDKIPARLIRTTFFTRRRDHKAA